MTPFHSLLEKYTAKAYRELGVLGEPEVHAETALNWAGRAIAAKRLGITADYASEAIEHASLSGDDNLLNQIRSEFRRVGVRF